jgi:hypothetical protein
MKKVISLLAILTICIFYSCKAQKSYINCGHKKLTIKKFVTDSMFSYNNRYVKYEAVKSIKESKFPVEIRVYSTWMNNNIIDLMILQATTDSVFITKKRIWIAGKLGIPKYEIVQRGDNYTVNVATLQKKSKNENCNFYSSLISNHFFEVMGSYSIKDFKRDPNKNSEDSFGNYEFEIKVGEKFRNFNYGSNSNFIDPNKDRGPYMEKIIKILFETLRIKT